MITANINQLACVVCVYKVSPPPAPHPHFGMAVSLCDRRLHAAIVVFQRALQTKLSEASVPAGQIMAVKVLLERIGNFIIMAM